jgi:autoinducer 2-degrading protein
MVVTVVQVWVNPENAEAFLQATLENHSASRREPGNLRFDILRDRSDPAHFILYEAYATEEAAAAHKKTAHYLRWREAVEPWMAKPREGTPCSVVAPQGQDQW